MLTAARAKWRSGEVEKWRSGEVVKWKGNKVPKWAKPARGICYFQEGLGPRNTKKTDLLRQNAQSTSFFALEVL